MSSNLLSAASALADRGWTVIPVEPGKKKAADRWKRFQRARPTQEDLAQWFGPSGLAGGIAVLTGSASGGLAIRDYDKLDAYNRWASQFSELAATLPTVETHRGRHVYFTGPTGYKKFDDGEYRAKAGIYCVVPPSPHPNGGYYRWLIPLPPGALPVIDDPAQAGLIPSHATLPCNTEDSGDEEGGGGGGAQSLCCIRQSLCCI